MKERKPTGTIANASPRPWRVEYTTARGTACVKAADNAVVAICHADNAELMVAAANRFDSPIAGRAGTAETAKATGGSILQGMSR